MMNARIMELIHAGIDGELDEREQAELDAALEATAEARQFQAGLKEFADLLTDGAPLEPPDELHRKIVDQISLPAPRPAGLRLGDIPAFVRYGLAAAAGLVLTVGLYESQWNAGGEQDINKMVGTIMQGDRASEEETLDVFAFDFEDISSAVSLQRRDGSLVLDVMLDSRDPVDITVDFTSDGLKFEAIAQMQSDLKSIEFADQAIQVKGHGQQHFAVLLQRDSGLADDSEVSVRLRFTSNGKLIKEGALVTR